MSTPSMATIELDRSQLTLTSVTRQHLDQDLEYISERLNTTPEKINFQVFDTTPEEDKKKGFYEYSVIAGNGMRKIVDSSSAIDGGDSIVFHPNDLFIAKFYSDGSIKYWATPSLNLDKNIVWLKADEARTAKYFAPYVQRDGRIEKRKIKHQKSITQFQKYNKVNNDTAFYLDDIASINNEISHKDILVRTQYDEVGNPKEIRLGRRNGISKKIFEMNGEKLILIPTGKNAGFFIEKDGERTLVSAQKAHTFLKSLTQQ